MKFKAVISPLIAIALMACASAPQAGTPRVRIYGDSISACHHCWPNQLEMAMGMDLNIQNTSQAGRTLAGSLIEEDLYDGVIEDSVAVIFLGVNDWGRRLSTPHHFKFKLKKLIETLKFSGFQVLVVNIPFTGGGYRKAIFEAAQECEVAILDLMKYWPMPELVPDGVHPSEEGSHQIAAVMAERIYWLLRKDAGEDS